MEFSTEILARQSRNQNEQSRIHREVSMSLRSSTEGEKEWPFLHMLFCLTRHSRARGNLGLSCVELAWIPAFAGMTEPSGHLRCVDPPRTGIFEEGMVRQCSGSQGFASLDLDEMALRSVE